MAGQVASAPGFPHFHINNFLETSFANEIHDAFPSFAEAAKMGKLFSAVNEKRKIQVTDSSKFPSPIYRLHQLLASDAFVGAMSEMMAIPGLIADPALNGGGIHETNSGGHLDVHVDFNYNEELKLYRRVNILIYFNKDWRAEYGGYLDLWDKNVENCLGVFAPAFNSAVGFATSEISWHGVTPVTCPVEKMRKSFAVYYYTKEPPPDWDGIKHSTLFKARPSELWKGKVAMPAEQLVRSAKNSVHSAKQAVKKFLKDMS